MEDLFSNLMMIIVIGFVILFFLSTYITPILLPLIKTWKEFIENKREEVIKNEMDNRRDKGRNGQLNEEGGQEDEQERRD